MEHGGRSVLGQVFLGIHVNRLEISPQRAVRIVLLLMAGVALIMTGYGIVLPVFAKRLAALGYGVQTLSWMTMGFAVAQFFMAPLMGSAADRFGRRPLVLVALATFALTNVGFLLARTLAHFVAIRVIEGALTAGLFPAAMGVVADLFPEQRRGKWLGILMGSYGAGFTLGPVLGGVIFDHWGFAMPFAISAALGLAAFLLAVALVPETHRVGVAELGSRVPQSKPVPARAFLASLPRPLYLFSALLMLDFVGVFSFAFVEPQMVFYVYDRLGLSPSQFGVIVGGYGLASVIGQVLLGQASDRFGRKPMVVLGLLLTTSFYLGLLLARQFGALLLTSAVGGLGGALFAPAASAFYLDITAQEHRSRVIGIKESIAALGGVVGPLATALVSSRMTAQAIFATAGALTLSAAGLAALVLRERRHAHGPAPETGDEGLACERAPFVAAALQQVVATAHAARAVAVDEGNTLPMSCKQDA